jgi:Putative Ig domain
LKKIALLTLLSAVLSLPAFGQSGSYSITVAPAAIVLTPASGALPAATVGVAYTTSITISGGQAPFTVTVSSGALPANITATISGSTLTIAGTPTAAGTDSFTLTIGSVNGAVKPAVLQYKPVAPTPYVKK